MDCLVWDIKSIQSKLWLHFEAIKADVGEMIFWGRGNKVAIDLTTREADKFIKMLKVAEENGLMVDWKFIVGQDKYSIEFLAMPKDVEADIRFRVKGCKRQKLSFVLLLNSTNIALLRIDKNFHTNPDGTKLSDTHIHIYQEGYGDKWAYPLDNFDLDDVHTSFLKFLDKINFDKSTIDFRGGLI